MKIQTTALLGLAAAGLAFTAPSASALTLDAGNTKLTLGGYVKFDAMFTDVDGDMQGPARDYYRGARLGIPTEDPSGEGKTVFDMHAKETRVNLKTVSDVGGHKITAFVEIDFMESNNDGNELVSNSFQPRLRHAFINYGNWTVGQAWSTFFNVGALPEALDFIGPAESTVFMRQPLIRYTNGNFQIALENPQSRITTADGVVNENDNTTPDVALRFNMGPIVLAGLVRNLTLQDAAGNSESTVAGGVSLSGKFMLGKDDLKFMVTAGNGLGRYVGVIGNEDGRQLADGSIEANDAFAAFAAYRHHWNDKARSSLIVGMFSGDEDAGGLDTAGSVHVNYLYSPVKPLTLGVELMTAQKENFDGTEGAFTRLQFSGKVAF